MTLSIDAEGFTRWLEGRPPVIQELAKTYPPTDAFRRPDGSYVYVIGWDEGGMVLVTEHCPFADYHVAFAGRQAVHPHCLDALAREDMSDWDAPR